MLFLNGIEVYSQDFFDELRLKLPKQDQSKILKANTYLVKGKSYLVKSKEFADSMQLNDKLSSAKTNDPEINFYYSGRINASYCFKTSNGILFGVLDKNIRLFWKNHPNEKQPLELILKLENASYDSLVLGDKFRAIAERKYLIKDKIPLVSQAETIEEKALFNLSKVLYLYLNWPLQPDLAWLYSDDNADPYKPGQNKEIRLSSIILDTVTVRKDTLYKSASLYSLMHITENQIDMFNQFLKKTHPDKMESYLINFQKLPDTIIGSLHIEWRKYLNSEFAATNTLKTEDFIYKVQIAASRIKMGYQERQKIYSGNELIIESFEDKWFKYTIGSFQNYNNARKFRDELKNKIKGAFVIAYYNGIRIKITPDIVSNKTEDRR